MPTFEEMDGEAFFTFTFYFVWQLHVLYSRGFFVGAGHQNSQCKTYTMNSNVTSLQIAIVIMACGHITRVTT